MPVPALLQSSSSTRGGVASASGRSHVVVVAKHGPLRRPTVLARGHAHPDQALMPENFGARDPTAGEIASNFGEKVLGNWDTEHIIKPPDAIGQFVGLGSRECQPAAALAKLDEATLERLRQQVPGWRVVAAAAATSGSASPPQQCIRREWAARDAPAAEELAARLRGVVEQAGHAPLSVRAEDASVACELSTPAAGGLTENDFIVASRLNAVESEVGELLAKKRQRFWA